MKTFILRLLRYAIIYIVFIGLFFGLLVFSAALPKTRQLEKNMRRSAGILLRNGDWPNVAGVKMDYFVDSLILNVGYTFDPDRPVHSSLDTCYSYKADEATGYSGVTHLDALLSQPRPEMKLYHYWRYWFGHSAVMKILHYFFHLKKLYAFLGIVTVFLLFLGCLQLLQKDGKLPAFALFALVALCHIHAFFMSLQYYPVLWIGLLGLIVLNKKDELSFRGPVFFALGMLTAYFDLLTAPVLAFGIPALFICGRDVRREKSAGNPGWKTWLRIWCGYPAAWLAGYVLSWGTKILLGGLIGCNIYEIVQQVRFRTGNVFQDRQITWLDALQRNFNTILYDSTIMSIAVLVVFLVLLIVQLIALKRGKMVFSGRILLGYLLLAVMPVAVILLMPNHTYQHAYMTYRGLAMTFTALLMALTAFHVPDETGTDQDKSS